MLVYEIISIMKQNPKIIYLTNVVDMAGYILRDATHLEQICLVVFL